MGDFAYIETFHQEPPSTATTGVHLVVKYGERDTRLYIQLKTPIAAHLPHQQVLAAELRELADALLRIAENPSAILPHDHRRR